MVHADAERLTVPVLLVVLGAGVVHASWNAITKSVDERVALLGWLGGVWALCGGLALTVVGLPPRVVLPYAAVSTLLHVGYDFALVNAYRLGSFNQMYPVARGVAPLMVLAGATVLAGERSSPAGLAGVVVLSVGLMSLALSGGRQVRADLPALGAALLTGLAIASYSLVDGLGVRHATDALAYVGLLFAMEGPALVVVAGLARRHARGRAARRAEPARAGEDRAAGAARARPRGLAGQGLLAGVLSVVAYGAVVWAQQRAPLGEVSALRETGVISAAAIGALFLREPFGPRRIAAAVLVAAGVVLIGV